MTRLRRPLALLFLGVLFAFCAHPGRAQVEGEVFEEIELPEYDENNVLKWLLRWKTGTMMSNQVIDIADLHLEIFEGGTNLQMTVTAPQCFFDQRANTAQSPSSVRIEGGEMVVTGEDFTIDVEKERFQIRKDVRVEIRTSRSGEDLLSPAKEKDE